MVGIDNKTTRLQLQSQNKNQLQCKEKNAYLQMIKNQLGDYGKK